MKDTLIDMMVMMMPYMKPFMWFAVVITILGFLFIIAKFLLGKDNKKPIALASTIVIIAAVFFMAAQVAGYFLSMPPTVNFGDSSKFEFILVSFWQIGLGFLVAGLLIKFIGAPKKA